MYYLIKGYVEFLRVLYLVYLELFYRMRNILEMYYKIHIEQKTMSLLANDFDLVCMFLKVKVC